MPQMATFDTPATDKSAGRMVQRAITDIWIADTCFEERPTIMTRFVADTGWTIVGGCATFGMVTARLRRSATSCRARITSVPGSKTRIIDESPGTEVEWIDCRKGVPLSN